jgi:phenol 2-monooxygenase
MCSRSAIFLICARRPDLLARRRQRGVDPREGGYLARFYVEMDKLEANERASQRNLGLEQIIDAARQILHPYSFDVQHVAWWSIYEIGQRLCPRFDNVATERGEDQTPRIFIAGDACHTHSPKAGQGMNVSMQDGFNLGWKLAAVLRGQSPDSILKTYSAERYAIAKELIDFDREWAAMLSAPLKDAEQPENGGVTPEEIQAYFVKQGRYTAGTATRYTPSLFTGEATHQDLAIGFPLASVCTPRRWCACATPAPCIWGTRFCRWSLARFCLWRAAKPV